MRSARPRVWLLLGGVAAVAAVSCQLERPRPTLPVVADATPVGTERCLTCHAEVGDAYRGRPHVALITTRSDGCETCHGAGSKHVESLSAADILGPDTLRALAPHARSALCLSCHQRDVPQFPSSEHASAEVSCWDCHAEALHHAPPPSADATLATQLDAAAEPRPMRSDRGGAAVGDDPWVTSRHGRGEVRLCYQCHAEVTADFMLQFHHPVPEGSMRCTDCHAMHGGDRTTALDRENNRCLACHEEIRGPFVFEHLALEDGCMTCHAPHGSIVEKLLVEDNNGLCQQCHFDARFPLIGAVDHTGFLSAGARCWDCHFQVHGSNTDENFVPLRIEELRRGGGRR